MFMKEHHVFIWPFLIAVFVIIFILHILENRKLNTCFKKERNAKLEKEIIRFQRLQSIKLFFIMIFSLMLIIAYDWQTVEMREQIKAIRANKSSTSLINSNQQTIKSSENEKCYYPPIVQSDDANKEAEIETKEPPPIEPPVQNTIQDIFGTKRNTTDTRSSADNIKTRYEEILVTYFLMQKCQKTNDSDYQLIISALQKEVANSDNSERLQNDILTAAKGSYEEMYSQNDCLKPVIETSAKQYNNYINSLSKTLPSY
jgi:hypothetical protein